MGDPRRSDTLYKIKKGNLDIYYIPAYLGVVVKRLENMNLKEGSLNVRILLYGVVCYMTIVLRIQLKGLPENVLELVESVKGKLNTQTIEFTQDMSHDTYDEDGIALRMFILRDSYPIHFEPNMKNFPSDVQQIPLQFELNMGRGQGVRVMWNLHTAPDVRHRCLVLAFAEGFDVLPDYNLAVGMVELPALGDRSKGIELHFPMITMGIPLYREPESALVNLFFPLFVLNFVNLGVFLFDADDITNRIGTLITILLALFAFLPTYNDSLPRSHHRTVLDFNISFSVGAMMLGFVDSIVGYGLGSVPASRYFLGCLAIILVLALPFNAAYLYINFYKKKIAYEAALRAETHYRPTGFDCRVWKNDKMQIPEGADVISRTPLPEECKSVDSYNTPSPHQRKHLQLEVEGSDSNNNKGKDSLKQSLLSYSG